uniref:EF-hand domain-containing protein n=1 Tax=Glossina brevipalpis TaxID=37001 RepID=A0A1A9WCN5_9MUSC
MRITDINRDRVIFFDGFALLVKRVTDLGHLLPEAVDYNHTDHLDLNQYKLFFLCLGLSDENAAVSFAAINNDSNGLIPLNEFVRLGRQFFLTEDETKISKLFCDRLIDH